LGGRELLSIRACRRLICRSDGVRLRVPGASGHTNRGLFTRHFDFRVPLECPAALGLRHFRRRVCRLPDRKIYVSPKPQSQPSRECRTPLWPCDSPSRAGRREIDFDVASLSCQ
jgi:hypothetical protein